MQKWHNKQSKKYISKVSVGFVNCHEWRIVCNRPTLACPRITAAAIAFEVALQVASVARSVFMTSQLYRRGGVCLRCQSYQGTVKLTRVDCLLWYVMTQYCVWVNHWHVALFNYVQCPRNYCDGVTLNQCLINNNNNNSLLNIMSMSFTHNFIHLWKRQHNYTQKNESEHLTNQQHETLTVEHFN